MLSRFGKALCCALLFALAACSGDSSTEFQNEGRALMQQGNAGGAVIFFKNALEKNPTDFETRLDLAKAYLQLGKIQQAEDEFQKCLRQKPDDKELNMELARLAALKNDSKSILGYLQKAEDGVKPTAEARELAGMAYAVDKNLDAAEQALKEAIAIDPARESSQIALARIYLAKRDPGNALAILDKLLAANPGSKNGNYMRADMAARMNDNEKALGIYRQMVQNDPQDQLAHFMLAFTLLSENKIEEGAAARDAMRAATGESARLSMLNGLISYIKQDYKAAADAFQQSVNSEPSIEGYYRLGLALYRADNLESALSALQKILDIVPNYVPALKLNCTILMDQGRLDDAQQRAEALIAIAPEYATGHFLLGSILNAKGEKEAALKSFETALKLDPDMSDAELRRTSILMAEGRHDEAKESLVKMVEDDVDNINAQVALFNFYMGRRNYQEAERTVNAGLSKRPDSVVFLTMRATLQAINKNQTQAIETLEKVRQLDPDYKQAMILQLRLYTMSGQNDKALALCRDYLKRHPDSPEILVTSSALLDMANSKDEATAALKKAYELGYTPAVVMLAQREMAAKNPDGAETLLKTALAEKPMPMLRDALVEFYLHSNKPDAAIDLFTQLEKSSPEEATIGKFRIFNSIGRYEDSLEQAKLLMQHESTAVLGAVCMADALEKMKRPQDALNTLDQAYQKTKAAPLLLAMGQICLRMSDPDKAETYFRTALQLNKDNPDALSSMGYLAMRKKKYNEAVDYYERSLRLQPENLTTLNNLAMAYAESGNSQERALDLASKAFALQPRNPQISDTLAYCLIINNRHEDAINFLRETIKMHPSEGVLHYRLGTALLKNGKKDEARQELGAAIKIGNFQEASDAAKLLEDNK